MTKNKSLKKTTTRVLLVTSSYPSGKNDLRGTFIVKQVQTMVHRGFFMVVLTPHIPGSSRYEVLDGIPVYRFPYFFPFSLQRLCGSGGLYFGYKQSIWGKIQIIPYVLMMTLYTGLLIRREKINLIHSHWVIPQGIAGGFWQMITGIPHITTSHVLDVTITRTMPCTKRIISWVLSHTRMATVNSSFTLDQLIPFSPLTLPISIIPMGMDETRIKTISESNLPIIRKKHSILFVGRLIDWKGVEVLINAVKHLISDYPDLSLQIIGEGPEKGRYEGIVRDFKLDSTVTFRGQISDAELNQAYIQADLFVLPSQEKNGIIMEGLGVVLIEAIAHGVPVIGSRIGGIIDIIEDGVTGYLVQPGDEKDLAEKISWVFDHPQEALHSVTCAKKVVLERFSWEFLGQQFEDAYLMVLEEQKE